MDTRSEAPYSLQVQQREGESEGEREADERQKHPTTGVWCLWFSSPCFEMGSGFRGLGIPSNQEEGRGGMRHPLRPENPHPEVKMRTREHTCANVEVEGGELRVEG
jgi:hypothetical protein